MTRTSGSDGDIAHVHSGDAAAGSRLCIAPLQRLCDDSKLSNCTVPQFLAAALAHVMRVAVPIPAVASASALHSAAVVGSVVGVVGAL